MPQQPEKFKLIPPKAFRVLLGVGCLFFFLTSCTPRLQSYWLSELQVIRTAAPVTPPGANPVDRMVRFRTTNSCGELTDYEPDPEHLNYFPEKQVRVNFHFVNSASGLHNYEYQQAYDFIEGLLISANKDLAQNNASWLPYGNDLPVLPTRYQLKLTPDPAIPNDRGIYFHYDDEVCFYVHKGANNNLNDRRVIERYAVRPDSVLNIFIMPHHPDSVASPTYKAGSVGVMVGNCIKIAGPFEEKRPSWVYRGLFNHEIGHIFGLTHAWQADGCDDTPQHRQPCWNRTDEPPCDTAASNNVMDYNALQNAFTPCQISKIQQRMADEKAPQRRFLAPTWCHRRAEADIRIADTLRWVGAKDLEGNLTLASGARLTIACRVSLPADARITLEPGATLILEEEGRLHNACGGTWEGIEVQRQGRQVGQVILEGKAQITGALGYAKGAESSEQ
ncbi:MAG: hypothetical protein H6555_08515 [Lewinellaceae bacterium]|nr:hypothetical protein [Lewinellaceae bacterium]